MQRRGWEAIARGAHALLVAPTGSGKTLAAFLWALDRFTRVPADAPAGVRVLYVSPLKALVYDVERNLRAPLAGLRGAAVELGLPLRDLGVDVRTGDTPPRDRSRQARRPADLLVTTPESLFLLLGSRARETLRTVETVIVDEVHAVLPTKRGAHLTLTLERLAELAARDPQRIGLSATVRPLPEAAAFLGGDRPVEVVDASAPPLLDLRVVVPVADMERVPAPPARAAGAGGASAGLAGRQAPGAGREGGLWAALYPALLAEIRSHRSTIVFVNSRGLCERLTQRLNELAGEELVRAHHGSVARERRLEVEDALKRGRLKGLVATSSLELGIDMGAVDRVLLVESPGSAARGLQRVGRAGHGVGEVSVGRIYPKFRGDLLECAVVAERMLAGEIEPSAAPRNPLDVLAQQVAALCCERPRTVDEIEALVRRAYPFRGLARAALASVLEMLSGRYPSTRLAELRPLLSWDRERDLLSPRRGAELTVRLNAGTIPDRGTFAVHLGTGGPRLGELDEEMVFETRVGDHLLLGASSWRVEEIGRDRVLVSPAPGEPGRLPFWHGDGPGRPVELGAALGALVREVGELARAPAARELRRRAPLDRRAAANLVSYLAEQREHTGTLPTDRSLTVERFRDELGDWRVCLLSPWGSRVHAPWGLALQQVLPRRGFSAQVLWTDDGLLLHLADAEELPAPDDLFPDPDEVEDLVAAALGPSSLFAGLFRENAARALLLPRGRPEGRRPLWAQRLKAQGVLAAVQGYPDFPIVLETYRQALRDVFDLPALVDLLRKVRSREIGVVDVETPSASPFARSLVFAHVAASVYETDAPPAERRAQALSLDRNLLAELLGQAELRELLDPGALEELSGELQRTAADRRAGDADALHDLLRRLGDLSAEEVAARCDADPEPWLAELVRQQRVAQVTVAGQLRWIAAEDAGLYRDALGWVPPPELPDAAGAVEDPLEALLGRFARTRGPFCTREAAARFGLPPSHVGPVLRALESEGRLLWGELRPGGAEAEWCDPQVLRRLKRRTLARLRGEAAPVDGAALARFLVAWHGLGPDAPRAAGLEEAIGMLEGLALPWSELAGSLLASRAPGFRPEELDLLCAAGRLLWVGRGSLGPRDGLVALYRREAAGRLLAAPASYDAPTAVHGALLAHLTARGASFYAELLAAAAEARPGTTDAEVRAALWDLVWAGRVTNDTLAPLRTLGRPLPRSERARRRAGHPLAGGRWSLVPGGDGGAEERALARADVLLRRHGVVSREAAAAEEVPGGFGPLYRALRALEEAGRVWRGRFVEDLTGAQFALPGALDRLRALRAPGGEAARRAVTLSAVDPANPYGAVLPWPEPARPGAPRPRRAAGAAVVLVGGRLVLHAAAGGRHLLTFSADGEEDALDVGLRALRDLPRRGARRPLTIEWVDGVAARDSAHWERMLRCGFESDYRGAVPAPRGAP